MITFLIPVYSLRELHSEMTDDNAIDYNTNLYCLDKPKNRAEDDRDEWQVDSGI